MLAGRRLDASISGVSPDHGVSFSGTPRLPEVVGGVRWSTRPAWAFGNSMSIWPTRWPASRTCPDLAELVGELLKELQAGPPAIETTKKYRPQPARFA